MAILGPQPDHALPLEDEPTIELLWTHQRIFEQNRSYFSDDLSRIPDDRAIRLLRVFPGQFHNEISCELRTTYLPRRRSYCALSDAWGMKQDVRYITINGAERFVISTPLWSALQRLRQHDVDEIWVDAIFINQATNAKCHHQVAIMADIYSKAQIVHVWRVLACPRKPVAKKSSAADMHTRGMAEAAAYNSTVQTLAGKISQIPILRSGGRDCGRCKNSRSQKKSKSCMSPSSPMETGASELNRLTRRNESCRTQATASAYVDLEIIRGNQGHFQLNGIQVLLRPDSIPATYQNHHIRAFTITTGTTVSEEFPKVESARPLSSSAVRNHVDRLRGVNLVIV